MDGLGDFATSILLDREPDSNVGSITVRRKRRGAKWESVDMSNMWLIIEQSRF
jgi:hypothetical protein